MTTFFQAAWGVTLELAPWLERNVAVLHSQRDRIAILQNRLPAKSLQSLQHSAYAPRTIKWRWLKGLKIEDEFLVLSADTPVRRGRTTRFQILDKLAPVFDGYARG